MSLNVCIVGAGTMGAGIAQICAQAGWSTVLHDAMPEGLTRGMERIESFWAKGIARGKTSQAEVDAWRPNLRTEGVFEAAVERADLVIEAVPERFELKARIFAALEAHAPSHCILASNTSGISIGRIAQEISTPGRVIGMHFFNPVPIMELLEIVTHDALEETTLQPSKAMKALGKTRSWFATPPDSPPAALAWCWGTRPSECSQKVSQVLRTSIRQCALVIGIPWVRWSCPTSLASTSAMTS